ncbi:hypothetical protein GLYMA_06G150600v4 [Glycine max]|uniref:Uncharacterized protein n=1 Tax=Glycine max TaxID=3847 RepID=K7KV60_SOYBN|nr:hypothetical protein JHK87_015263 [Glycine soja]KAG5031739.1 hypothetical protein JHK85_015721 [Glycine max]KAH1126003.1 hypothetical protein GYH30_015163 [Glycine max]KRH53863.1 hypothetical protein GLYMA_06G150600v4 [Glycine max]
MSSMTCCGVFYRRDEGGGFLREQAVAVRSRCLFVVIGEGKMYVAAKMSAKEKRQRETPRVVAEQG